MKVFQIQTTLYQMQTLLNKYRTHDLLPTNYRTIVAPNNRIARTYHKHNTRPQTKYKQHTPYQIQNYCIATIQQIQNNVGKILHTKYRTIVLLLYTKYRTMGENNTHIILHTKYRKTHITTPNTEKRIPNTEADTARTLQHQKCPYRYRNLHRVVIVAVC